MRLSKSDAEKQSDAATLRAICAAKIGRNQTATIESMRKQLSRLCPHVAAKHIEATRERKNAMASAKRVAVLDDGFSRHSADGGCFSVNVIS